MASSGKFGPSASLDFYVDQFYSNMEFALRVELVSTFGKLVDCRSDDELLSVVTARETQEFDHLPVIRDGSYVGLLHRAALGQEVATGLVLPRSVGEAMEGLGERNLIAAESPLFDFIAEADVSPARLVLKGAKICGIVTVSDLHKLPVRTALSLLLTHFELLLTSVLRARLPADQLFGAIRDKSRSMRAAKRWEILRANDRAIDQFGALDLLDKYELLLDTADVLAALGSPGAGIRAELEAVYELRNAVAHARDYALTGEKVGALVSTTNRLRDWISRLRGISS